MRKLQNYLRRTNTAIGEELENVEPEIDHHNSLAWDLLKGCIYVNDDRFVNPQVEDKEGLVSSIREGLYSLTDGNGEPIFRDIVTSEEAYEDPGPDAPDLIVRPKPGYHTTTARAQGEGNIRDLWGFDHRYDGIFAAAGPAFESSQSFPDMSLVDVLPTILHALGKSVPTDFDGRAKTEILSTGHEVDTLDEGRIPTPQMRDSLDEDRDEIVKDRLEDLGYIN